MEAAVGFSRLQEMGEISQHAERSSCSHCHQQFFLQNYTHLDDNTGQTTDSPGFKPFTMLLKEVGSPGEGKGDESTRARKWGIQTTLYTPPHPVPQFTPKPPRFPPPPPQKKKRKKK